MTRDTVIIETLNSQLEEWEGTHLPLFYDAAMTALGFQATDDVYGPLAGLTRLAGSGWGAPAEALLNWAKLRKMVRDRQAASPVPLLPIKLRGKRWTHGLRTSAQVVDPFNFEVPFACHMPDVRLILRSEKGYLTRAQSATCS